MFNYNYLSKAEQVAKQLFEKITESNLEPGQTVGTEAVLMEAFNVSRPTLREGIRILETRGIVRQRPGPGGGIVVQRPSLETLAMSFSAVSPCGSINAKPFPAYISCTMQFSKNTDFPVPV